MSSLSKIVAAHPLRHLYPYNAIKFARVDGCGTPLYTVAKDKKEMGAAAALRRASQQFGGHCFYCDRYIPKEQAATVCTRDHVRPRADGGQDYLHNLVFACLGCNQEKGAVDVVSFSPEDAQKYLKALDGHLTHCVEQLAKL